MPSSHCWCYCNCLLHLMIPVDLKSYWLSGGRTSLAVKALPYLQARSWEEIQKVVHWLLFWGSSEVVIGSQLPVNRCGWHIRVFCGAAHLTYTCESRIPNLVVCDSSVFPWHPLLLTKPPELLLSEHRISIKELQFLLCHSPASLPSVSLLLWWGSSDSD